jgi:hypothetical protein
MRKDAQTVGESNLTGNAGLSVFFYQYYLQVVLFIKI